MKKTDPFLGKGVSGTPRTRRDLFIVCPHCQKEVILWSPAKEESPSSPVSGPGSSPPSPAEPANPGAAPTPAK